MDKPLKSVTHGQCDARTTVTFPVAGHRRTATGTELRCLVTAKDMNENVLTHQNKNTANSALALEQMDEIYAGHVGYCL